MGGHADKQRRQYRHDGTYVGAGSINVSGPGLWVSFVRGKERAVADELEAVLEELVDELYPAAQEAHRRAKEAAAAEREGRAVGGGPEAEEGGRKTGGDSFEDELKRELEELRVERDAKKGKGKRPPSLIVRRNADVDCLMFFSLLPPISPVDLTLHFLRRVASTGVSHLHHVQRLLPATHSCHAVMEEVGECLREKVLPPVFGQGRPVRFKVLYQAAQSDILDRDALINLVATSVPPDQGHTVDLSPSGAEWLISVRLFRSTVSLALIPNGDYERLKKFNVPALREVGMRRAAEEGSAGRGGRVVLPGATSRTAGEETPPPPPPAA